MLPLPPQVICAMIGVGFECVPFRTLCNNLIPHYLPKEKEL